VELYITPTLQDFSQNLYIASTFVK